MLARPGNDQRLVPVIRTKRRVLVGRVVGDGSNRAGLGQYVDVLLHVTGAETLSLIERRLVFRVELEEDAPDDVVLPAGRFGVALFRRLPCGGVCPTKAMGPGAPQSH